MKIVLIAILCLSLTLSFAQSLKSGDHFSIANEQYKVMRIRHDSIVLRTGNKDTGFNTFKYKYFSTERKEDFYLFLAQNDFKINNVFANFTIRLKTIYKKNGSPFLRKLVLKDCLIKGFGIETIELFLDTMKSTGSIDSLILNNVTTNGIKLRNVTCSHFATFTGTFKEFILANSKLHNLILINSYRKSSVRIRQNSFLGNSYFCIGYDTLLENDYMWPYHRMASFDANDFKGQVTFSSVPNSYTKIFLKSSTFHAGLSLNARDAFSFSLKSSFVTIKDTLKLETESPHLDIDLSDTYFEDSNAFLKVPLYFNISDLRISPRNLIRLRMLYKYDTLDRQTLETIQENFYRLALDVSAAKSINPNVLTECTGWLDHLAVQEEERYLAKSRLFSEDGLLFIWRKILDFTVNNGFNGEAKFIRCVAILTLSWSIIYYLLFRIEVTEYVLPGNKSRLTFYARHTSWSWRFVEFFKCVWFSFIILINPRFPASYFKFSNRLLSWLIVEWILGIFLTILFLIFIVSKYPFSKFLFGL